MVPWTCDKVMYIAKRHECSDTLCPNNSHTKNSLPTSAESIFVEAFLTIAFYTWAVEALPVYMSGNDITVL